MHHRPDARRSSPSTSRTSAADIEAILDVAARRGIPVIEDTAQSFGATLPRPSPRHVRRARHLLAPAGEEHHRGRGRPRRHRRRDALPPRGALPGPGRAVRHQSYASSRGEELTEPFAGENLRMGELAGAVAGVQLARLPDVLDALRANKAPDRRRRRRRRRAGAPSPARSRRRRRRRASRGSSPTPALAKRFAAALRAEGVPCAQMYRGRPVYLNAGVLARATASDKGGPWACAEHPTDRTYGPGLCPRTEALVARSVIVPIGVRYTEADCDDIAAAVAKVAHALLPMSERSRSGSAPRSSRRRRRCSSQGFIEDQPATEVHDDLEVRAVVIRGSTGCCACSCATCSACRAASRRRSATRSPAALGTTRARGADVVRAHARRAEHDRGQRGARVGDTRGLPRAARRALRRRGDPARGDARAAPRRCASGPGRCRPGCRSTGAIFRTTRASRCSTRSVPAARGSARSPTSRSIPSRSDPSASRCRATGSARSAAALEQRAGGTAVLLSGALGDVNPRHVHRQNNDCRGDGFAEAETLGREVAEVVDAALGDAASGRARRAGGRARARRIEVTLGGTPLTAGRDGRRARDRAGRVVGRSAAASCRSRARRSTGWARTSAHVSSATAASRCSLGSRPSGTGYLPSPFRDGYEENTSYGRAAVAAIAAALT